MGPRCDLVDQQSPVGCHEELDAGHPDDIERLENLLGHPPRGVDGGFRKPGRHERTVEDVMAMMVERGFPGADLPTETAGRDDREFAVERYPCLEDQFRRSQRPPGGIDLRWTVDASLPLAVIPRRTSLEHGWQSRLRHGGDEVVAGADQHVRGTGDRVGHEKRLLTPPILGREQHLRPRTDRHHGVEVPGRRHRHVFELVRHHGETLPQGHQFGRVVEESGMNPVAVPRRRAIRMLDDRLDAVAHPPGGGGEHGAELASSENAERGAGENGCMPGGRCGGMGMAHVSHAGLGRVRSSASTRAVCSSR